MRQRFNHSAPGPIPGRAPDDQAAELLGASAILSLASVQIAADANRAECGKRAAIALAVGAMASDALELAGCLRAVTTGRLR